jgi:hypothetical protein
MYSSELIPESLNCLLLSFYLKIQNPQSAIDLPTGAARLKY